MRESSYRVDLIKKIKKLLPEALVIKSDPRDIQGFPDIIVLYKNMWAALELKVSTKAPKQPNQGYYVKKLGAMSFASFVSPETEKDVLDALQRSFGIVGKARVSKS